MPPTSQALSPTIGTEGAAALEVVTAYNQAEAQVAQTLRLDPIQPTWTPMARSGSAAWPSLPSGMPRTRRMPPASCAGRSVLSVWTPSAPRRPSLPRKPGRTRLSANSRARRRYGWSTRCAARMLKRPGGSWMRSRRRSDCFLTWRATMNRKTGAVTLLVALALLLQPIAPAYAGSPFDAPSYQPA
jgi:hypothetical protein